MNEYFYPEARKGEQQSQGSQQTYPEQKTESASSS
jgi:hypothetical protein